MNIEEFRNYCIAKKGATEALPFDEHTLVFKVMGKMFALTSLNRYPAQANLKCNQEKAIELRETYDGIIIPGYHMNKKHWNTILLENTIAPETIKELVDHSYDLVVIGLTKKAKTELDSL